VAVTETDILQLLLLTVDVSIEQKTGQDTDYIVMHNGAEKHFFKY